MTVSLKKDDENPKKLIRHPFSVRKKEELNLFQTKEGIEYHFTDHPFSPKICSTTTKDTRKYLEIEINEDGNGRIVNEYVEIEEFKSPADFYIPLSKESSAFYEEMHEKLLDTDPEVLEKYAEQLNAFAQRNDFPDFIGPVFDTKKHDEIKTHNFKVIPRTRLKYHLISINTKEETPIEPPEGLHEYLIESLKEDSYLKYSKLTEAFCKGENVFLASEIRHFLHENRKETHLQLFLREKFYTFNQGPFRNLWIKLGYDPRNGMKNSIYQLVDFREAKCRFMIRDCPELVEEVMKNPDWYLVDQFDEKSGFLTDSFFKLAQHFSKGNFKKMEESTEESEFSIFD